MKQQVFFFRMLEDRICLDRWLTQTDLNATHDIGITNKHTFSTSCMKHGHVYVRKTRNKQHNTTDCLSDVHIWYPRYQSTHQATCHDSDSHAPTCHPTARCPGWDQIAQIWEDVWENSIFAWMLGPTQNQRNEENRRECHILQCQTSLSLSVSC